MQEHVYWYTNCSVLSVDGAKRADLRDDGSSRPSSRLCRRPDTGGGKERKWSAAFRGGGVLRFPLIEMRGNAAASLVLEN